MSCKYRIATVIKPDHAVQHIHVQVSIIEGFNQAK